MATAFATISTKPARKAPVRRAARLSDAPKVERADIYQEVTNKIIAQLEAGVAPWVQPWSKTNVAPSMPRNASTGRNYNGVNVLLLWAAQMEAGYPVNAWMTFKQAQELGANVRRGEKGTAIVYADKFTPKGETERAARDGDEAGQVFFLKRFCVFNIAQIDGLPEHIANIQTKVVGEREQIEAAERVIEASGIEFRIGGDKAYYVPALDYVQIPDQRAFHDQVNYYRTAMHELAHATGHGSRLSRHLLNEFGSKDYAREELIAEMGSAFVNAALGIVPTVRHADYIGSWLRVLREDKRAIFKAASGASKAADWLLSRVKG